MNTEEKVLSGFLGLLAVAGIVVLIVLLVKKNSPGPGPGPRSCCAGDSQYNCGFYKNKNDCNEAGPADVPGGCKWKKCPTPGPATVPACNVSGGNGVCTSGINTQGKRNCVGGDQLCGVNLAPHQALHPEDKNCSAILTNYGQKMIKCNDGYQASVDEEQGNCVFKCKPKGAACCGITDQSDASCALNNKEDCIVDGKCKWSPTGCMAPSKENFEGDAGPTPCGTVTGWPVCGGVCPNNKHCGPWGNGPGSPHGCDCM